MHNDFLRQYRFAVSFDDQAPLGFNRVEIAPKRALHGPGMVLLGAAMTPLLADLLSQTKTSRLTISAYTGKEDIREDAPALLFVLHGVRPASCRSDSILFAATSNDILKIDPTFDYQRLELRQGDRSVFDMRPRARNRAQHDVVM